MAPARRRAATRTRSTLAASLSFSSSWLARGHWHHLNWQYSWQYFCNLLKRLAHHVRRARRDRDRRHARHRGRHLGGARVPRRGSPTRPRLSCRRTRSMADAQRRPSTTPSFKTKKSARRAACRCCTGAAVVAVARSKAAPPAPGVHVLQVTVRSASGPLRSGLLPLLGRFMAGASSASGVPTCCWCQQSTIPAGCLALAVALLPITRRQSAHPCPRSRAGRRVGARAA